MAYGRGYYTGYRNDTAVEMEPEQDLDLEAQIQVQRGREIEIEEETLPTPARQVVPRVRPRSSRNPLGWALAAVLAVAMTAGLLQGQPAQMPNTNPAGQVNPNPNIDPLGQPGPAPLNQPGLQGLQQPGPATLPGEPSGGSSIPPASQPPINPPVEPMPKNPILPEMKDLVVLTVLHPCSTYVRNNQHYQCQELPLNMAQLAEVNSSTVNVVDFINGGWRTINLSDLKDNLVWYGKNYGFYCPDGLPSAETRKWELSHPSKMGALAVTDAQIAEAQGVNSLVLDITPSPLNIDNDWTQSQPLDFSYGDWSKFYRLIQRTPYPAGVSEISIEQLVKEGKISGFTALVTRNSKTNIAKVIGIIAPAPNFRIWVDTVHNAYPNFWGGGWSPQETLSNGPYQGNLPSDRTPIQILAFGLDEPRPSDYSQGIVGRPVTMLATWHVQRLDENGKVLEEAMWGTKITAHY